MERLLVYVPTSVGQEFWTEVHECVQEQLTELEREVGQLLPGIRTTAGRTHGKHFLLFSYRAFSGPNGDVDPVVAGIMFRETAEGIDVEADISGEQIGDLISPQIDRTTPYSREALLAVASESARELCKSAKAIVAALENPSRNVN